MLERKNNPALFDKIYLEYCKTEMLTPEVPSPSQLKEEDLLNITSLVLDEHDPSVTDLKGIEFLPNLTTLRIKSTNAFHINRSKYVPNCDDNASAVEHVKVATANKEVEEAIDRHQITDLSPISQCKNLRELVLVHLRNVKDLDISNNTHLESIALLGCKKLQHIIGLDKNLPLRQFKTFLLDASGCDVLNDIDNFDKILDTYSRLSNPNAKITLPTTTYCHLCNKYEGAQEILDNFSNEGPDPFCWSENLHPQAIHSTIALSKAKDRCDQIIARVCGKNQKPNVKNMAKLYRWMSDYISYDTSNAKVFQTDTKGNLPLKLKLDSDIAALWSGKAVCVGIASLYNLLCADLGVLCSSTYCNIADAKAKKYKYIVPNHQICKIETGSGTYYCDPTCDLGTEESKSFMLTTSEISERAKLCPEEKDVEDAESIQWSLEKHGYLTTNFTNKIKDLINPVTFGRYTHPAELGD